MFSLRDLNKIDDLMQEVAEQQDVAQEISDAFSQRIGLDDGFDEVGHAPRHTEHCGRHRGCRPPLTPGGFPARCPKYRQRVNDVC